MPGTSYSPQRTSLFSGSLLVLAASLAAFAGWIAFLFLAVRSHRISAAGLFPRDLPFTDFYLYRPTFEVFHTPLFFQPNEARSGFAYPPLVAPLYRFFYLQHHKITWYRLFTLLLWAALLAWVYSYGSQLWRTRLRKTAIVASVFLCYPAVFLLERGNLELFVWITGAAGIFFYQRRARYAAALCFGFATALKLYPIVLLGLFLGRRGAWRPILLGLATAVTSTALAIAYTGPTFGFAALGFLHGVTGFQQHYGVTVRPFELRFDHSLFAILKVFSALSGRSPAGLSGPYFLICGVAFTSLFFLRVLHQGWQSRILFLSAAMVLLPPVSYEYTLVHLYIPLLVFMGCATHTRPRMAGWIAWASLLTLLLPNDLLSFSTWFQAGQVQSLLLLLVAACATFPLFEDFETQASRAQVGSGTR